VRRQRRVPFLARDELEAARDANVRRTVRHAAKEVPYYREWFARAGIDPGEIGGAADLERLPVLDRELVRSDPLRFVAERELRRRPLSFLTSGSTGTPLEIYHDRRSLFLNIPFGERERAPVIAMCGGSFRPRELYVGYETSTFKKVMAFYAQSTLLPVRPRRRIVSVLESPEAVAEIVNAERPDVLSGYGGWIDVFFRTVAARSIDLHPPKLVMYMGEALPPGTRGFVETELGIPVLSRYNAVESFKIGFYCERRTGFHLHEDICHVRVVRPDGRTAAPGEQGRVVISNLVNRATVLLNYPIGDLASMSPDACPCGRTPKLLSELEGREEDVLPLADGRFVHPRAVWEVFKSDRAVLQYQLTQHEPTRFELTLTTLEEPDFQQSLARALPELERLLGSGAVIDATRRSDMEARRDGKFRAVASLL